MKRNSAQAGEGKLESRFAALTSGLLARKGQAAPSNSPIHDPAEETDAFALEPTNSASKKKAAELASAAAKSRSAAPSAKAPPKGAARDEAAKNSPAIVAPAVVAPAVAAKVEAPKPAAKPAQSADAKSPPAKPAAAGKAAAAPITIINERSEAAGYPDNPSPEEIAALEAEADEVVSYFENFGNDDAVALEKDNFYGVEEDDIEDEDDEDDFDDLDDVNNSELRESDADGDNDAPPGAPQSVAISGPWAGASVPPVSANSATTVRAGVTVQLTAREFMRLSLGAAELDQSAQELIVEAIEEYLDARGVLSLGGCSCLEALTKKPGGA